MRLSEVETSGSAPTQFVANVLSLSARTFYIKHYWVFNDLRRKTFYNTFYNTYIFSYKRGLDSRAEKVHCYQQCSRAAKIAALHFFIDKHTGKSACLGRHAVEQTLLTAVSSAHPTS